MRYAFMTYSCPDLELKNVLQTARHFGYDAIEPRLASGHRHGLELDISAAQRQAARDQFAAAGIELGCIATSCRYADAAKAPDAVADTHRAIDLAADLGFPGCGFYDRRAMRFQGATRIIMDSPMIIGDCRHRAAV